MSYVNGWCINEDMINYHAENYDNILFGEMIVHAMGINASCLTFCKSSRYPGHFVLAWTFDGSFDYTEIFTMQEILDALRKIKIVFEPK